MSDSVDSVIEMFQEVAADSVTTARDSLIRPFRDVILGSWSNLHQGYERTPEGQISGLKDKQYSCLPGDEENYNPNGLFAPPTPPQGQISGLKDKQYSCLPDDEENYSPKGLFAPPTPPRTNTEGVKPSTPMRLYTPKR